MLVGAAVVISMSGVSAAHAALAAIRDEMEEHPLERRRDFPPDEVRPVEFQAWRARQAEYARREAALRSC